MSKHAEQLPTPLDPYEHACDQAIAACGGDMRSAVKALLLANEFLEHELAEALAATSNGYRRGRGRKPKAD